MSKTKEHMNKAVLMIEPVFIDALLQLQRKLAKNRVDWALGGELGEALKSVKTKPDCIEIFTSKKGAVEIFLAVKDCSPTGIYFQTQLLSRKAEVKGREYPIYVRSNYFEFSLTGIKVKVHGGLQFRIDGGEWAEKIEFNPDYIYVVGFKTAIVPLQTKYKIYSYLGWQDRLQKINQVISLNEQ